MRTDSLFYELFQTFPSLVLELLGNPSPTATTYSFSSQEVKQTSFRLDGILTPAADAVELPIYFIEVQGYSDSKGDFYPSLFSEIFLYLNDYRPANDWQAVVIFTQRRLDPGLPLHYQDCAHSPRLKRIYLDELTVTESSLELGVLQLIGVKLEAAPQQARQLIQRSRQELTDTAIQRKIVELVETVMVYKFPNLSRQEIEQMFGLNELKQTRYFQDVLAEGLERGLEQGKQQGELAIVVRLLTRRLGTLEQNLQLQLQQLSSTQLERLAEALLDFATTADLVAWLGTN